MLTVKFTVSVTRSVAPTVLNDHFFRILGKFHFNLTQAQYSVESDAPRTIIPLAGGVSAATAQVTATRLDPVLLPAQQPWNLYEVFQNELVAAQWEILTFSVSTS